MCGGIYECYKNFKEEFHTWPLFATLLFCHFMLPLCHIFVSNLSHCHLYFVSYFMFIRVFSNIDFWRLGEDFELGYILAR